jgi:hypothetical protein
VSDKRGKWSKQDKRIIWNNYVDNMVIKIFRENQLNSLDLTQRAPCPYCGKLMFRAQYQGVQPNQGFSWDIDHINGNSDNNSISNLQPMHPWCNKRKN